MAQLMRAPTICFNPKLFPKHPRNRMALNANNMTSSLNNNTNNRKLPILLFDIMDTIVRDPFYHDIPAFFRMSFKELIECKHPTAWIEFENGVINEEELAGKFFKDGRPFDLEGTSTNCITSGKQLVIVYAYVCSDQNEYGLKNCMRRGYSYIDGIEQLLQALKQNNYEMHAFTNYPIWYKIIEDKLNISNYLSWTFCSCMYGTFKDLNYTQFTIDITLISQCLSVYLFISVSASVDVHVRERRCLLLVSDLILACVGCVTFVSVMFSQLYTLLLLSS
ncbi:hypothetical protein SCA6_002568 [Theobroma cacao]